MGHYAVEMLGGGPDHDPEPKPETGWLVDNDFTVVTVEEFDKKHSAFMSPYGPIPLNPRMARMSKTIYKTRVNAEKGARKACEQAVEKARADLLTLKNILKVVRPWEKK